MFIHYSREGVLAQDVGGLFLCRPVGIMTVGCGVPGITDLYVTRWQICRL